MWHSLNQTVWQGEILFQQKYLLVFQDVKGCEASVPKGFLKQDQSALCHAVSAKNGQFRFGSLPVGEYSLVPFYQGKQITFDVAPQKMDFTVAHNSLVLEVSEVFHCCRLVTLIFLELEKSVSMHRLLIYPVQSYTIKQFMIGWQVGWNHNWQYCASVCNYEAALKLYAKLFLSNHDCS